MICWADVERIFESSQAVTVDLGAYDEVLAQLSDLTIDARDRRDAHSCPRGLEKMIALDDGETFLLRPIHWDDAPALIEMSAHCEPSDLRLRFLGAMRELSPRLAAKLSEIDYEHAMAFVAMPVPADGISTVAGVVRLAGDPDGVEAEYAVFVRSDLKHHGLGRRLMLELLSYARAAGYMRLFGHVLAENAPMLALARQLGGQVRISTDDCAQRRVVFDLAADAQSGRTRGLGYCAAAAWG
jgi:GNAT superfamily N-acetyltransferase